MRTTSTGLRPAIVDAIIFATIVGLFLSTFTGCASCNGHKVAASLQTARMQTATGERGTSVP